MGLSLSNKINRILGEKLAEGATLFIDKHRSYQTFTEDQLTFKYKALMAKGHVGKKDKTIHLPK